MNVLNRSRSVVVVLVLAGLAGAQGALGQTAAEVVANVRKATGIEALAKSGKAIRLTGGGEFLGEPARTSLTIDGAGRYISTYQGPVSIETVHDGRMLRTRDFGGEGRDHVLGDRSSTLFGVWAVSGMWFMPERADGFELDNEASDERTVVLSRTIDDGRATMQVWVPRETWRPSKWVLTRSGDNATIELEGTRAAGGTTFPASMRATTSTGLVMIARYEGVGVIDLPDWAGRVAAIRTREDTTFDAQAPARLEGQRAPTGHILVRALVDGKDVGWFIFDTGAGQNVIDLRAIETLKLPAIAHVPATGVGGSVTASIVEPPSLTVGPMTISRPVMIGLDLKFLDQYMGVQIAGIVGFGSLARCVAEIDQNAGTVSIFDPRSYTLEGAEWTPLLVHQRVPCVPGKFEGHEAVFRLDTGAGGGVTFHQPTTARLELLKGRDTTPTVLGGVGGMKAARAGKIQWLELGGRRHADVDASFATVAAGAFADAYTDANIGSPILGETMLVMDYPHDRIAFKERPKKND